MRRSGFTLVEMLVATALVVLMMLLFAQVFQIAANLIGNQKGMAELDQSVRSATILLRGDIDHRTFRVVVPFEPTSDVVPDDSFKRGFFSISENDPNDGTDDVLHLTIQINEDGEGSPELPYSGKAALLRRADPVNGIQSTPDDAAITAQADAETYLLANTDQPEFDDGQLIVNGTGSSRYAEVAWFLRNGTLYRRQLLIREGYDREDTTDPQPVNAAGERFVPGDYTAANVPPAASWHNASGEFWRDFDYSAYHEPAIDSPGGLRFHSFESLINSNDVTQAINPNLLDLPASLGIPFLRFGSSTNRASIINNAIQIQGPREMLAVGDKSTWIGRFTHQETSHSDFDYPGNRNGGDPFNDAVPLAMANGLVSEFSAEKFRRGEDIMMTNVHSFDIQVWDDSLRRFVDLGNGSGDYAASANSEFGNRYDTWHPNQDMPAPPFLPLDADGTPKPLRAIKIDIRFYDVSSDSMRDLTFTFPLT